MQAVKHKVQHHYQPTNNTCGYAALAIFLSHYGMEYTPEEIVSKIPQPKNAEGTSHGSVTAQLAEWCQSLGLQTHMYSSDCLVLDLSWKDMDSTQIKERLQATGPTREVLTLGNYWTKFYVDTYLSMLDTDATLSVVPFITTDLLYKLLQQGPVFANINATANDGVGRTRSVGLRESVPDDAKGKVSTHSIVIYGNDEDGNYLVADPWDGMVEIEPEQMVLAIAAAQIECDNQCFVIENKKK